MANATPKKPVVLIVLDGFGYREGGDDNAILAANSPNWDRLWQTRPHTLISGSGRDVGLPAGQMGNSEVGHMSLGAGRIIYQSITRIDAAIEDGSFFSNPAYTAAVDQAVAAGRAVHVMGLLSDGGVHSHDSHIHAMLKLAAQRGAKQLYLHAFLDGRDTPPRSASTYLQAAEQALATLGCGRIASLTGRYYAMDRDKRWDRVEKAYALLTEGHADFRSPTAAAGLEAAYARDENDEFVKPTIIGEPAVIADGDAVIFMNFRADRAREITRAFVDSDFDGFTRKAQPKLAAFVMTTEYADDIEAPVAFGPESLDNVFPDWIARHGKTQLRIAETEKYAHVTFFFSGGREALYDGEDRILVPSPDVATYDLKPEMSAYEVTDKLVDAIKGGQYDAIICNYANGDMVGHTGVFDAAVKAVEALDTCIQRVVDAVEAVGGQCLITADHGNCEQMYDPESGQNHTQHTTELVPLVYVGPQALQFTANDGRLPDIAPTLLSLMGMPIPKDMTGRVLLAPTTAQAASH
ncbi:MAG: 2,3-bisphosphoglycerate-independent phosphoglycerate mutase [Gammaproteobacteria bacterium]|nr:MAG: 2,3-bisphosphoglycerate-independent phosphoglycerate mutase [Gammaproteobacteria bacterium]